VSFAPYPDFRNWEGEMGDLSDFSGVSA